MKDGANSRIDNLRVLARRARNDQGNDSSAKKYYDQILLEDPNDWEAFFFSSTFGYIDEFCDADVDVIIHSPSLLSDIYAINEEVLDRATGCLNATMKLLKNQSPDSKCEEELEEIYAELERLSGMSKQTLLRLVVAFSSDAEWVQNVPVVASGYVTVTNDTDMGMFITFGDLAQELFGNDRMAVKGYNYVTFWQDTLVQAPYYLFMTDDAKGSIKKSYRKVRAALKPIKEKLLAQYWEEHPDKKRELDTEKEELSKKKELLKSKIENIKSEREYNELKALLEKSNAQLEDQRLEFNKLGLFKRKEKQALQEKIQQTQKEISEIQNKMTEIEEIIVPVEKELVSVGKALEKNASRYKEVENSLMAS